MKKETQRKGRAKVTFDEQSIAQPSAAEQESFNSWEALNAETARRIQSHPTFKMKSAKQGEQCGVMAGICHQDKLATDEIDEGIQINLTTGIFCCGRCDNQMRGVKPCDTEDILTALRLPPRPGVRVLDEAPRIINRPLALIDGKVYVATWLHVEVSSSEPNDESGDKSTFDQIKTINRELPHVITEDGKLYGEAGLSLKKLGFEVKLREKPTPNKLWSKAGFDSYRSGQRTDAAEVFNRIVDVVDHFIDFDHSLADQRTMAELVTCWILTTWFLEAFNVVGYLWPNAERGSGKTKLLNILAELGYLGHLITAGGTFATLRDMADYGSTMCFDDAENLSDSRKTDPDKRALLLAGNRRGTTVTLKESIGNNQWQTRHVNAFCPRAFSAINLPDAILASRTILIPLVRSADQKKANVDVADHSQWPHDRRKLIDDLWSLALANLSKLSQYDATVNEKARLSGRNLEPWKAILAVALWLEDQGMTGIWERMEGLALDYQKERHDMEKPDLTTLVIRALCQWASSAICAIKPDGAKEWVVTTEQVSRSVFQIACEFEADIIDDEMSDVKIGRVLGKLRLPKLPRSGGQGSRRRSFTSDDLKRWQATFSIQSDDGHRPIGSTGSTGSTGSAQEVEIETFDLGEAA